MDATQDETPSPPRLSDVAKKAGVSAKTASRVLNGERYVAERTRDRVLAAAATLGFAVNPAASSLARGLVSNVVSLIAADLSDPVHLAVAGGVEAGLRGAGYRLIIACSDEQAATEYELLEEFTVRRVRTIMLISTLPSHEELARLPARGMPLMFLCRRPVGLAAESIAADDHAAAAAGASHLLGHGHRRLAYVGPPPRLLAYAERQRAFTETVAQAGAFGWHEPAEASSAEQAEAATRRLLLSGEPPTAVLGGTVGCTVGALRAIGDLAPETALVGCGDFRLSDLLGVTTVAADADRLGRMAAAQFLDQSPSRFINLPGRAHTVPFALHQRGSGERPPAR
jgi:LacI family transcriptional regulator